MLITTLIGLLYAGYIYIQSTDWSSPITPLALNLINSTIWGITLEFLNFVVFYKASAEGFQPEIIPLHPEFPIKAAC